MKVHQVKKEHAAATIERTQAGPVQKQPTPSAGTDARMQAAVLVAEVVSFVKQSASRWHGFAWRLIDGTTDMRAEFIKQMEAQRAAMIKECVDFHGWTGDVAKSKASSIGVEFTRMTGIAKAFNGGYTLRALLVDSGVIKGGTEADKLAFADKMDDAKVHAEARDIGVRDVYECCKNFNRAEATTTKTTQTIKVRALNFIKACDKIDADTLSAVDKRNLTRLTQFIQGLEG